MAALEKLTVKKKGPEQNRALFLTGLSQMGLKQWEGAKASFREMRDYPLQDYAEWNMLLCDYHLGNHPGVVRDASRFLSTQPKSRHLPGVRLLQTRSYMALLEWKKAETLLRPMLQTDEKNADAPEAFQLYYEVLLKQGKIRDAYKILQELFCYFPNTPEGVKSRGLMKSLVEKNRKISFPPLEPDSEYARWARLAGQRRYETVLQEIQGVEANPKQPKEIIEKVLLLRGLCYRSLKDYVQAQEAYKDYVKKFPKGLHVAESLYWIAYIHWNLGRLDEALDVCAQLEKRFPKNEWTDLGYLVMSGVMENKKDFEGAISYYLKLLNASGSGLHAEKAAWKIAWSYYQRKDYAQSLDRMKKTASQFPLSSEKEKALFWAARCAERLNRTEEKSGLLEELFKTHSYGFYMFMGRELFGEKKNSDPLKLDLNLSPLTEKAEKAEQEPAKREFFSLKELKQPDLSQGAAYHLARATELTEIAFNDDVLNELRRVYQEIDKKKLDELTWLGQLYYQAGAYSQLLSMMNNFLITVSPKDRSELPDLFWRLYYPPVYMDVVSKVSARHGVDPFLVLGLMRQESSFEKTSLSSAGAIGLMQLMPQTGEKVFKKVYNTENFSKAMLYDPELNIELGVFHLAELIKENGGNVVDVLAGYNAGGSKVAGWKTRFPGCEGEEFIEMIPYGETRGYVKKVLQNYYNYKRLYGGGNGG